MDASPDSASIRNNCCAAPVVGGLGPPAPRLPGLNGAPFNIGLNASELLIERRKTTKIRDSVARTRKLVTEHTFCGELSGQITTGLGISAQMTTKNSHRK